MPTFLKSTCIRALVVSSFFVVGASIVSAATLGPGCREATAEDKAAMKARGIPESFQVCPADELLLGVGKDFEQWYSRIKSEDRCRSNKCTLSCRTRNTGAQRCGPTSRRWGSIGCHPNNSTAIFPTVSHGFAAHIELLRRYCGEFGKCTIGAAITKWAPPNVHNNSTRSYVAFVSRVAGVPANQVYDPNDVDLVARLATAMSCYEAGSLPYSAAELKAGLVMAAGGKRVATPANVGALLQESLTGSYATNPSDSPGSTPDSWLYPKNTVTEGKYTPKTGSGVDEQRETSTGDIKAPPSPSQSASASLNKSHTSPSIAIVAWPDTTTVRQGARIAWTSIGMDAERQCVVKNWKGTTVATGTTGTLTLLLTKEDAGKTLEIHVSCTPENPTVPELIKEISVLVAQ